MYFGIIEDERDPINTVHPLVDILKLIMIAMLCGMDELDKVVDYGESKKEFLEREFNIKLIPSRSILTRVMAMISPKWLSLSIVWILNTFTGISLGQITVDSKSNEIPAGRELIEMLNVEGMVITEDFIQMYMQCLMISI